MKRFRFATILLTLLLCMMSTDTFAYDFEVGGIYYNLIDGKAAEVTSGDNRYSWDVVIPEQVTFEGVVYPVVSIGKNAFQYCSDLLSVTIPNSVTSIETKAFFGCEYLTSVTIPNSVTSIGEYAFNGCTGLTSITIPNSVTSIGWRVFYGCTGLTSVTIPNSVTSIGGSAFPGCTGLTSVTIPNSVTSIGGSAFYGCTGLTSVTIPNSVTSIGYETFSGCRGLTSITIPNSVTSIGKSAFSFCTSLTSVNIPNCLTNIESETFYSCTSLTSITIPNSVTSIGEYAFSHCSSLTSVTIPNNIKSIGKYAFSYCRLKEVYCYAEELPSTEANAFESSNYKRATLYVPASAINDYKNRVPWSEFGAIETIDGTNPGPKKCATPTISYHNGKLTFTCETEGVEYRSSITDTDINDYTTQEINLSVTYTIKVYAMKSGCQNSDVATGTLCWIDVDPRKEGITDGVAQVKAMPVLIKSHGGQLTVEGAADDTTVSVYNAAGMEQGSAVSKNGQATISTTLEAGSVAIVKIGQRAVKVVMR